jgi:hypothetical protein
MKTPKTSVAFSAVVAIVCSGVAVVVVWNVFGCGTRHEADLIEQFRADPFFATAPHDGTLVEDGSEAGSCNERDDGYIRGVTWASKVYQTPTVYSFDELRQLFDRPAQAGGWGFEQDIAQSHPDDPNIGPGNVVTYCKQTATEVFYATARSAYPLATGPERSVSVRLNTGFYATPCGHNDHPGQIPSAR